MLCMCVVSQAQICLIIPFKINKHIGTTAPLRIRILTECVITISKKILGNSKASSAKYVPIVGMSETSTLTTHRNSRKKNIGTSRENIDTFPGSVCYFHNLSLVTSFVSAPCYLLLLFSPLPQNVFMAPENSNVSCFVWEKKSLLDTCSMIARTSHGNCWDYRKKLCYANFSILQPRFFVCLSQGGERMLIYLFESINLAFLLCVSRGETFYEFLIVQKFKQPLSHSHRVSVCQFSFFTIHKKRWKRFFSEYESVNLCRIDNGKLRKKRWKWKGEKRGEAQMDVGLFFMALPSTQLLINIINAIAIARTVSTHSMKH